MKKTKERVTIKSWLKTSWLFVVISAVILLAAILRLYNFAGTFHFMIDEGTHAQAAKDILTKGIFPGRGPGASVDGGLYHGPFYYYLLTIPAFLGKFAPISYAYFTATCSIFAIVFLHLAASNIYGKKVALFTTVIFSFSYLAISFSRWAWNPNFTPFFFALGLLSLSMFLKRKQTGIYLPLFAFAFGALTQLHIANYIFIPILLLYVPFLYTFEKRPWAWIVSVIVFLVPWIPCIVYEVKDNHLMLFRTVYHYYFDSSTNVSVYHRFFAGFKYLRDFSTEMLRFDGLVILLIAISLWVRSAFKEKEADKKYFSVFLLIIILFTIYGFGGSKDALQWHNGEYLILVISLSFGLFASFLLERSRILGLAIAIMLLFFVKENFDLYDGAVIHGGSTYKIGKDICEVIKNRGYQEARVKIIRREPFYLEETNPANIIYTCEYENGIKIGKGELLQFDFAPNPESTLVVLEKN